MNLNDMLHHRRLNYYTEHFRAKYTQGQPDECWNWQGVIEPAGYGLVNFGGPNRAHRVAWLLANGPIPNSGTRRSLGVLHRCDNRACVNPNHLFVGTDADNAADMKAKGRSVSGEMHYTTKITEAQVAAIRADFRPAKVIAAEYGISTTTVYQIQKGGTWKYVTEGPREGRRQWLIDAKPPKPPKPRTTVERNGKRGPKARVLPDETIMAIRNDPRTLKEIAWEHSMSVSFVWQIIHGYVGGHLPLVERKKTRTKPLAGGVLARLRRAAETIIAGREEMDEGWFVPAAAMAELDKLTKRE